MTGEGVHSYKNIVFAFSVAMDVHISCCCFYEPFFSEVCKNRGPFSSYMTMTIEPTDAAADQFAEAFELYADALFRHIAFRCFDRERAKELMQDAFMKAWDYVAAGKTIDHMQAFLYKTANNLIIDEARKQKNRKTVSFEDMQEEGFDIAGEDGRDVGTLMDAKQVCAVISKIDEPYRTTIIMRFIDELQPKEIAEVLGEKVNVVSVRIHRGLKMLQGLLTQYG